MVALGLGWAAAVAAASALIAIFSGTTHFHPEACQRFESHLTSHLVGQDLALHQASDAICDHLNKPNPTKPLLLSIHGPPGVGKSLFHRIGAQALYAKNPAADSHNLRCPGHDCSGYKVLYGMDYTASERAAQHTALRSSILSHVNHHPESLLIIEEYDKLDCSMRGFFRQILENSIVANVTMAKSIVVLESNLGWTELHQLLDNAGGKRSAIQAEHAQRTLKDLVFQRWLEEGCEDRTDTLKMVGLVDFFLPFFPLGREELIKVVDLRLKEKADEVTKRGTKGQLTWGPEVADFLLKNVDFEEQYAVEGAKEVETVITRYISRPVRLWAAEVEEKLAQIKSKKEKKKEASRIEGKLVVKNVGSSAGRQEVVVENVHK